MLARTASLNFLPDVKAGLCAAGGCSAVQCREAQGREGVGGGDGRGKARPPMRAAGTGRGAPRAQEKRRRTCQQRSQPLVGHQPGTAACAPHTKRGREGAHPGGGNVHGLACLGVATLTSLAHAGLECSEAQDGYLRAFDRRPGGARWVQWHACCCLQAANPRPLSSTPSPLCRRPPHPR